VKIDFDTLKTLSLLARAEYGLAGCVQYGASTFPKEAFAMFPKVGAAEIHLAEGFQNITYHNPLLVNSSGGRSTSLSGKSLQVKRRKARQMNNSSAVTAKRPSVPRRKEDGISPEM
jgi:hypothetical protein